jgi:hypothetical protein
MPARPFRRASVLLAAAGLLLPPAPVVARMGPAPPPAFAAPAPDALILVQQSCGKDCPDSGNGTTGGSSGISTGRTRNITTAIAQVSQTCSPEWVERRYLVDCLRWELRRIAQSLPQTGDYAPVRKALAKASSDLDAIVRRYADPSAPPIQPNVGGKPLAPQLPPLIGVRPEDEDRAIREAERVIEEAQTVLLRSAAESERRMVAYRDIATALDSTKVLLRSS